MRIIHTTVQTLVEWKEKDTEAYERCLDTLRKSNVDDGIWVDETFESLKGLFDAAGVDLKNYSIGAYCPSHITPIFNPYNYKTESVAKLYGPRAMAWLESNLLGILRIPWSGTIRTNTRKYKYLPGSILPCPFTGYCADDTLLDVLTRAVRDGDTLEVAFSGLAQETQKILECEIEYANSEDALLESADANEWEFDSSGRMI